MARWRLRAIPVLGIGVWARRSRALERRPRRSLPAGGTLPAGAVLAGLALLGASVPAGAQALTWSVVPSPNPGTSSDFLYGVSCAESGTCTAVGFAGATTLVESWNGTSWSVVPSPTVATNSELTGVAAVTASDIWATGITFTSSSVFQAFIEQWNGTSWSIVPSPNPGSASFLSGAAADPVSGQAWAVGNFTPAAGSAQQTLTEFNP